MKVVTSVCGQIWGNLEHIAQQAVLSSQDVTPDDGVGCDATNDGYVTNTSRREEPKLPALCDYVLMQLESLSHILSYCLLDTTTGYGQAIPNIWTNSSTTPNAHHQSSLPSLHSAVASFAHVIDAVKAGRKSSSANKDHLTAARQSLLSMTPRMVVALTSLWKAASVSSSADSNNSSMVWLVGSGGKAVKGMILELLSPLAKAHPTHFLAAVSIARWEQNNEGGAAVRSGKVNGGGAGATIVQLVSSLKIFPMTTVIATLRQILKSPPPISGSLGLRLEVYAMEFLSAYLTSLNQTVLAEAWTSLKDLLRDCLSLRPASVFLALEILHQSVTRGILTNMDKKEIRSVDLL